MASIQHVAQFEIPVSKPQEIRLRRGLRRARFVGVSAHNPPAKTLLGSLVRDLPAIAALQPSKGWLRNWRSAGTNSSRRRPEQWTERRQIGPRSLLNLVNGGIKRFNSRKL